MRVRASGPVLSVLLQMVAPTTTGCAHAADRMALGAVLFPERPVRGKAREGVIVRYVVPNSPADRAGIRRGAAILHVNGKTVHNPEEVGVAWVEAAQSKDCVGISIADSEGSPREKCASPDRAFRSREMSEGALPGYRAFPFVYLSLDIDRAVLRREQIDEDVALDLTVVSVRDFIGSLNLPPGQPFELCWAEYGVGEDGELDVPGSERCSRLGAMPWKEIEGTSVAATLVGHLFFSDVPLATLELALSGPDHVVLRQKGGPAHLFYIGDRVGHEQLQLVGVSPHCAYFEPEAEPRSLCSYPALGSRREGDR